MTSEALVLAALGAIGVVIGHSMLQGLPAKGGGDGGFLRSMASAGEIAASDGSGYGDGDRGVMVMNCRARSLGEATAAAGSRVRKSR